MKKSMTISLILIATMAVAACGRATTYERTTVTAGYRVDFSDIGLYTLIQVWTDPETGCQSYLTDDGFMSPRLRADGTQVCVDK